MGGLGTMLGFIDFLLHPWGICGSPNSIQEDLQTETTITAKDCVMPPHTSVRYDYYINSLLPGFC
jgi:hypothetical protein